MLTAVLTYIIYIYIYYHCIYIYISLHPNKWVARLYFSWCLVSLNFRETQKNYVLKRNQMQDLKSYITVLFDGDTRQNHRKHTAHTGSPQLVLLLVAPHPRGAESGQASALVTVRLLKSPRNVEVS